jgi:glycosyltransferase involved in cell wall biosynthesis
MKAPLQWIEAIAIVAKSIGSARLKATWLGDGPLLEPARERVRELGLESVIEFRGFVADRGEIIDFLRAQDVFAFCHVTPESPRCLIEALISGLPIVGYDSSYARELVEGRGGALLSGMGDPVALAANLIGLAEEHVALERLTWEAASNRGIYNDEAVFRHRSELIHQYL